MVKTDVRRDYYADLGLVPSADTDDIKKQFRKLGERSPSSSSVYAGGMADQISSQVPSGQKPRKRGGIQLQVPGNPGRA